MPLFAAVDKRKTTPPTWLKLDAQKLSGQVIGKVQKEDIEASIDPQMIIEYYSR